MLAVLCIMISSFNNKGVNGMTDGVYGHVNVFPDRHFTLPMSIQRFLLLLSFLNMPAPHGMMFPFKALQRHRSIACVTVFVSFPRIRN